ncbi:MAG: DUF2934 domain-containing protein [Alphaproteobacteria bacterium]|nr:MAG: DUF2934 domain-containing protein [Alphaproteobacteria bacterium]
MTTATVDERQIAEAAYYLWLEEGCPDNRAEEHWHRARAMLATATPKPRRRSTKRAATRTTTHTAAEKTTGKATAPRKRRTTPAKT